MTQTYIHKCKSCGNVITMIRDGAFIREVLGGHRHKNWISSGWRKGTTRPSNYIIICDGVVTRTTGYGRMFTGPCGTIVRVSTFKEVRV